jgi:hypothetical protein
MNRGVILLLLYAMTCQCLIRAQNLQESDTVQQVVISKGWSDEAISIGYITAPSVLGLMFISAVLSEWNAGYAGIPAAAMIFAAPPLIFGGGRSVAIPEEVSRPRAKLGWTLYALSIIPTTMALYGFATGEGATIPLTVASGILGSGSIIAMTTYAYARGGTALKMEEQSRISMNLGILPVRGGAVAVLSFRF